MLKLLLICLLALLPLLLPLRREMNGSGNARCKSIVAPSSSIRITT